MDQHNQAQQVFEKALTHLKELEKSAAALMHQVGAEPIHRDDAVSKTFLEIKNLHAQAHRAKTAVEDYLTK